MTSLAAQALGGDADAAMKLLDELREKKLDVANHNTWADVAAGGWAKEEGEGFATEPEHERIDEIRVVAQALAFRSAVHEDVEELSRLVNAGYFGRVG